MLELIAASRTYDDGHPVHALKPTTLAIGNGEYVTITGPSGSGKSTLLNLLGLLDSPTNGGYRVSGDETAGMSAGHLGSLRGRLFGFVFQAFHLLPGRTALENVELGMLYGPHRRAERRARALRAIEKIGLAHRAHADPRTLSGGERQRIAIARAIAGTPRVLFCDEPTGNLDSANTATVLRLLRELNAEGLTVVVITHDPEVAVAGTRTLTVVDGHVEEA
ncbi:putative ABC transport system ATP-binding protein [Lentzea albidocapillata subsp. violacea]|uniref:Putative ABC transport system ATP-binding protein n=1 Tax=Lentzea albidocapillata subsp. violacea TaxID=128104 RepID=A0A1G8QD27_9PSEU|nr:ABC transporter ATP-binding protein [Lentzea albidocapillata]SDJ02528.1 putative ABC transport system ATP-binding protein [Lentzea albidocapillata subsp. violacea]